MILLTAFEPFGSAEVNGSLEVAKQLEAEGDGNISLHILPVVREEATRLALEALKATLSPKLFIALGEAGPEPIVRLEKVYINWDDYRIPDNAQNQPRDEPIRSDGPVAYFSTLPVAAIAERLKDKTPYPVHVSLSAGSFLCNHLSYAVSDALAQTAESASLPFCFIHVPAWRPSHGEAALHLLTVTLRAVLDAATDGI